MRDDIVAASNVLVTAALTAREPDTAEGIDRVVDEMYPACSAALHDVDTAKLAIDLAFTVAELVEEAADAAGIDPGTWWRNRIRETAN